MNIIQRIWQVLFLSLLAGIITIVFMLSFTMVLILTGLLLGAFVTACLAALITGKPIQVTKDGEVIGEIRRLRYVKKTDEDSKS